MANKLPPCPRTFTLWYGCQIPLSKFCKMTLKHAMTSFRLNDSFEHRKTLNSIYRCKRHSCKAVNHLAVLNLQFFFYFPADSCVSLLLGSLADNTSMSTSASVGQAPSILPATEVPSHTSRLATHRETRWPGIFLIEAEGIQNESPQNVTPWHADDLKLKTIKAQQTQEELYFFFTFLLT